jgi:hypothetical protein
MPTIRLLFSLAFILLFSTFSYSTTVQRLTLDEMIQKSNKIVIGNVTGSSTFWSNNGKLILTSYTIAVDETIKGEPARTIQVTSIGGQIGNLTLHVAGMPVFEKGESAVVFVEAAGTFSTVVGLEQGKFTITDGAVSNHVADLAFPDGRPAAAIRMPLQSLKRAIRQRLLPR